MPLAFEPGRLRSAGLESGAERCFWLWRCLTSPPRNKGHRRLWAWVRAEATAGPRGPGRPSPPGRSSGNIIAPVLSYPPLLHKTELRGVGDVRELLLGAAVEPNHGATSLRATPTPSISTAPSHASRLHPSCRCREGHTHSQPNGRPSFPSPPLFSNRQCIICVSQFPSSDTLATIIISSCVRVAFSRPGDAQSRFPFKKILLAHAS